MEWIHAGGNVEDMLRKFAYVRMTFILMKAYYGKYARKLRCIREDRLGGI